MKTITRALVFALATVGIVALFIAARRNKRPRRMRASDPRPSDFVEILTPGGNGHANGHDHGHHQEAFDEF